MYKVIDVAKLFSVSKVTIYKKISANKAALKGHVIKKKNVTYLDDEAVEIIKNTLQINKEKASGRLIDEELNQVYTDIKTFQEENDKLRAEKIAMMNEQLVDLESAVRTLSNQIASKERQLENKQAVLENFKVILKSTKDRIRYLDTMISEYDDIN
jgi:chromosome segregation ATPase